MKKFRDKFRIESSKLPEYDYSLLHWYYVTINTKNHVCCFGEVINGNMILNEFGEIAENCWKEIPAHFLRVTLDYFVIMPNHLHGIIAINEQSERNTEHENVETGHAPSLQSKRNSLSDIVGSFKSSVSRQIHKKCNSDFHWQERFYDRIIRNENELFQIRKYIELNPFKWDLEKNNNENLDIVFNRK